MRTKKCGLIAVTAAVLLVTALLVTTCDGPFGLDGLFGKSGNTGTLQLNLGGNIVERTIMPVASEFTVAGYEITVTADSGGANTPVGTTGTHYIASSGPITLILDQGWYEKVEVKAYKTYTSGNTPPVVATDLIAEGEYDTAAFQVTGGVNADVEVTLNALSDGVGNGTFSWDFSAGFGASTTAAVMTIYQGATTTDINGGTTTYDGNIFNTATGSIAALPSGFYDVVIVLSGDANHRSRTISEKLHIYENTTSSYAPAQFAALVKNRFTVSYHNPFTNDSGGTAHGTPVTGLVYAATIPAAPTPAPDPSTEKDPSFSDWNGPFIGWFTQDGSAGPAYPWGERFIHGDETGTNSIVLDDMTLYAHYTYTAASAQDFVFHFTAPSDLGGTNLTLAAGGMTVTGTAPNFTIAYSAFIGNTLTITISGGQTITACRYTLDGTATFTAGATATTITIPFSALDGIGLYNIGIYATIGGVEYSTQATITITGITP